MTKHRTRSGSSGELHGTSVLATFKPTRDAVAVAGVKDGGAIIFGKNNLVEISCGLTGFNARPHHRRVLQRGGRVGG